MKFKFKNFISTLLALTVVCGLFTFPTSVYAAPKVYYQKGQTWSSHQYGYGPGGKKATIASSGCALLSLVNAVYQLNGNFLEPTMLADFSVENGYRVDGQGTSHAFFKGAASKYGSKYAFKYDSSTTSISELKSHLKSGGVATCIQPGHFMAITEYSSDKNKYLLLDSYPSSNRGTSSGYAWKTSDQLKNNLGITKYFLLSSTKPATPKISSVSATADNEITVKWNSVSGAEKYILQGRKAGGDYQTIAEITGTSYTHKKLDSASLYWYHVKAKNSAGTSGYSDASAAYTKPSTPTTSIINTSSIKVSWSGSGGNTSYELLARKAGDADYTTIAQNINGYTYTHSGLEAGTQYYYKIKAHNNEHSSVVSARSDAGYGYTKLNSPWITRKTADTVSLDWSRGVLNGDYNYTYRIRRKTLYDADYTNIAVVSNSSYTDYNLQPNTTYRYYVDVLRNGSYCVHSETVDVTTNEQPATQIALSTAEATLTPGQTYQLYATVLPENTTNKSVTWTDIFKL